MAAAGATVSPTMLPICFEALRAKVETEALEVGDVGISWHSSSLASSSNPPTVPLRMASRNSASTFSLWREFT
eukprot:CAMPEP_0206527090 /NCGR_PEP_ID=MMETSP0325_2-20121206/1132_1 /ASSEMBLY_ACC=CAM_ASM_000347 /TAXON_ID=2866 /ORGANISM="Crypthecodinium cohnii, Strain Seligo" /LENGTH=72 /DNA_ID=CAMNT_0054022415 /DNA_START=71 /DNA_END=289 /DNA_ORIENTATION=+